MGTVSFKTNSGEGNVKSSQERLIFKYPFNLAEILNHKELLAWEFSDIVLITAFDIFRDDYLVTYLQRTGLTLREYLYDIGFNQDVKILADTGIFEIEARKARLQIIENDEKPIQLTTTEILHAYELIDADYVIAPDEMILIEDDPEVVQAKVNQTLDNLVRTLDVFPKEKIYATIQGVNTEQIQEIIDVIDMHQLKNAARGGLLPMRRASINKFQEILSITEDLARKSHITQLHAFGLSHPKVMRDLFVNNSYDSVDTSIIYWYTSKRKYLTKDIKLISVNRAKFSSCNCPGCQIMADNTWYPNGGDFAVGLYSHNARSLASIAENMIFSKFSTSLKRGGVPSSKRFVVKEKHKKEPKMDQIHYIKSKIHEVGSIDSILVSASLVNDLRKEERITSKKYVHRNEKLSKKAISSNENPKILVISSCSKWKRVKAEDQPEFSELCSSSLRSRTKRKFSSLLLPAHKLYCGYQHRAILKAIAELRKYYQVDHFILSAGFGLIHEKELLPPYNATFNYKSEIEIEEMAKQLEITKSLEKIRDKYYDLVYLALSKPYLTAIGDFSNLSTIGAEVIYFDTENNSPMLPFFNFAMTEFYEIAKSAHNFDIPLGKRIKSKGTLLHNFGLYINCQNKDNPSFVKWWMDLFENSY
ncbi:MAG: hypothetical protein ACXAD7_03010 [Candidatus Kariarchaeaceae archaeon]|jgi:hypothetical protein